MEPGYNFANTRSIFYQDATANAVADPVLVSNSATLKESLFGSLVFPLSQNAIKTVTDTGGLYDTTFNFHQSQAISVSDGAGTADLNAVSPTGGTEAFLDTGLQSDTQKRRDFMVINLESANTGTLTGTISNTTLTQITGVGTDFENEYNVGEFIQAQGDGSRRITSISSATVLTVASAFGGALSAKTHRKYIPEGFVFDMTAKGSNGGSPTARTINVTDADTVVIDVKETGVSGSVEVYYNAQSTAAEPAAKNALKYRYFKINCNTNNGGTTGPWNLGWADVYNLVAVYVGSDYSENNTDYTDQFEIDDGQRDQFYDHSSLRLRDDATLTLGSGDRILVVVDILQHDLTSAGVGFYTVDSYPIDDTKTSNTSAIFTYEIPVYVSPRNKQRFNLRNCIDFRPSKANTVSAATTISGAPENPPTGNTFNTVSDGVFMAAPNGTFTADLQYYVGRVDKVAVSSTGKFEIIKGTASVTPEEPKDKAGSMTLATLRIPPYPSLPYAFASKVGRLDLAIRTKIANNRRYTMRDIRVLDQRIGNLEYYVSLSLLEKATRDLQILDGAGLNRFKNGIFVDAFVDQSFSDVENDGYLMATDIDRAELRPPFQEDGVENEAITSGTYASTGVTGHVDNRIYTLPYTEKAFINQPKASGAESLVDEIPYNWVGDVTFDYPSDAWRDVTVDPDIHADMAQSNDVVDNKTSKYVVRNKNSKLLYSRDGKHNRQQ